MNSPEVDFVERSICILNENEKFNNDMSLIINCTYGLLSFPYLIVTTEKCEEKKHDVNWWMKLHPWNKEVVDFPEIKSIVKGNHPELLGGLLKEVRDGLNHQPFIPDNKSGRFIGIKIELKRPRKKGVPETQWIFDADQGQLKEFLILIANKYLEYFKQRLRQDGS